MQVIKSIIFTSKYNMLERFCCYLSWQRLTLFMCAVPDKDAAVDDSDKE